MEILQILTTLVAIIGGIITIAISTTKYKKLSIRLAGGLLITMGCLVIIGYTIGSPTLYTIPVGGVGVAFPTAIAFIINGWIFHLLSNGPIK